MRYAQFPPQRAEFREWWCGLREESIWRGPREALPVFRSSRLVYSFSLVKNSCCVDEALLLMVALALWVAGEKKNGELRMSFSFFLQCTKEARETSIETAALRTGVSSVRRVREASRFRNVHATELLRLLLLPLRHVMRHCCRLCLFQSSTKGFHTLRHTVRVLLGKLHPDPQRCVYTDF